MALQIANPTVVAKVERLAKVTGMSKTALVERAVDHLERHAALPTQAHAQRLRKLVAQMDQLADIGQPCVVTYDENGLPN